MAYKITFDTKAKEIIKEVVTQGDTPEPTPASGTRLEFESLVPGRYTINCANLVALFKAKNVDIDGVLTDSDNGIIFGIKNYTYDYKIKDINLRIFNGSQEYIEGYFNINSDYNQFRTNTKFVKGEELTVEKALEAISTVDLADIADSVPADFRYAPVLGIKVAGKPLATYQLTKEEFESIIVPLPTPEVLPA